VKRYVGIAALAVVATAAMLGYFTMPAVGTPSPRALSYSLSDRTGGALLLDSLPCARRPDGTSICEIYDSQGSGLIAYSVRLAGRCWRARKVAGAYETGRPMPRRPAGCVSLRDQLRLAERLI